MNKLPDLEGWAIFAKVADTGSFAKAAAELALSQATVSKAITRLEAKMKTMLFHRTSRSMSLTESGYAALERAARILEEGEAVEAEVTEKSTSLHGKIRLSAPMSFGVTHLAPMLPPFMQAHPEVELEIEFSDKQSDLVSERFDLALRISNLVDSTLLARRLCSVRILLVGSPAYFKRAGRPRHPRDLAQHTALQYVARAQRRELALPPRDARRVLAGPADAPEREQRRSPGAGLARRQWTGPCSRSSWPGKTCNRACWKRPWMTGGSIRSRCISSRRQGDGVRRVQALIEYLAERLTAQPWA